LVNLSKSSIFFSKNTPPHIQRQICNTLNGISVHTSTKYLGLRLGLGKSKIDTFSYVENSVKKRILNWKSKFISPAGKEVLIKSV
ncbi:Unknown protein, partial [Striga hermonthica]